VSEDLRVSRDSGEPPKSGRSGAQRWADYLEWLREDIISGTLSLSVEEQHSTELPSGWTPIQLLNHVLHMEQRWFIWGFLGQPVDQPWGDWSTDPTTSDAAVWHVATGISAEVIAARLRDVGRRTREILQAHDLDAPARSGGRFTESPPTLEWICFHVLAEYARHAGQFDVVLELRAD
jgi:uncharacterized damage-inducible protein DinB